MKTVTFFISIALRKNNGENRHIFHFDYVTLWTKYLAKQKCFRRKNQGVWFLLHLLLKSGGPTLIDTILKNATMDWHWLVSYYVFKIQTVLLQWFASFFKLETTCSNSNPQNHSTTNSFISVVFKFSNLQVWFV